MNSSLWRRMPSNPINIITKINIIQLWIYGGEMTITIVLELMMELEPEIRTIFVIKPDQPSQLGVERPDQRT